MRVKVDGLDSWLSSEVVLIEEDGRVYRVEIDEYDLVWLEEEK